MTAPRTATNPTRPISRRFPQRLPDATGPLPVAGAFVRRAVRLTLALFVLATAGLLVIALTIPFDGVIEATGALEPVSRVVLRTPEAGAVQAVLVQGGDSVRAGQVVAYLDTFALAVQREQLLTTLAVARAELGRTTAGMPIDSAVEREGIVGAEAALVQARSALRGRLPEFDLGGADIDSLTQTWRVGSHVVLDNAVAQVRGAEAALAQHRATLRRLSLARYDARRGEALLRNAAAELRSVNEKIRRATVRSPTSGVVLTDQPDGSVGAVLREGDPLLEVADLRRWQLNVYVREQDAYRIASGDRVRAELPALRADADADLLRARVASVALVPDAAADSGPMRAATSSRGYRVVAPLDAAALLHLRRDRLKRGYTARVKILTDRGTALQLFWRSRRRRDQNP